MKGTPAESESSVRFGEFKLDLRTRELRSNGNRSYLQEQPFQVLAIFLARPGQLVTRDDLMKQLWPSDTFVDFDQSLNKAVNRLREALDDSADHPRFIETVPRRGYRFISPVAQDHENGNGNVAKGFSPVQEIPLQSRERKKEDVRSQIDNVHGRLWKLLLPAALLVATLLGGGWYLRSRTAHKPAGKVTIVLADFVNNTSDPVLEDALQQALLASLDQSPFLSVLSNDNVREQLAYMGRAATDRLTEPVAREVCQRAGSTVVLVGSISSLGTHYALGLNAVNCQTGKSVSRQEAEVESQEKILQAVDRISTKTRETLGESLGSIQKYNVPLDQATTSSLEALRFYRVGLQTDFTQGSAAAIPFFKQAIALDPNFSIAYEAAGISYNNFGQADLARTYLRRAVELSSRISADEKQISWSAGLKQALKHGVELSIAQTNVRHTLYRPYCEMFAYFDEHLTERPGQFRRILPDDNSQNLLICVSKTAERPFNCVATSILPNRVVTGGFGTASQCFPFYTYAEDGSNRRENITDWGLEQFRVRYHDSSISKWDIFHYIYAVLHHPEYRERYAANLRRELPRIPFASSLRPPDTLSSRQDDARVFRAFVNAGERLAEFHVHYEKQPEYPLTKTEKTGEKLDWRVTKMRLSKDKTSLIYNQFLTLSGVPPETYEYRLGNRSALDWVIDQYQVSIDKRSGITNDPNRASDPQYILRLIGQVVTVSLETVKLVRALPPLRLI